MDTVFELLNQINLTAQHLQWLFMLLVGSAVLLISLAIIALINNRYDPLRRRLGELRRQAEPPTTLTGPKTGERIGDALEPYSGLILPSQTSERTKVANQLVIAGYRSDSALTLFYALKVIVTLLPPTLVLVLVPQIWPDTATPQLMFYAALAASMGVIGPNIGLRRQVERRQRKLRYAFPDALDLLVVCIEAGLGLNAALQRVAKEIYPSYPELSLELRLVDGEIRAGMARVEALKNLYVRTGLDDIRGLVSLLTQSLRFGGSIADTLRIYAEDFRDQRMQRAEEAAAKIGTKMVFPLVFCLFPAFFLVAVGPAVIRIVEAFSSLGG